MEKITQPFLSRIHAHMHKPPAALKESGSAESSDSVIMGERPAPEKKHLPTATGNQSQTISEGTEETQHLSTECRRTSAAGPQKQAASPVPTTLFMDAGLQDGSEMLIPETERLQKTLEAKRGAQVKTVTIIYGGEPVTAQVEIWEADYRTEEQKRKEEAGLVPPSPVGVFIPGFGQMDTKSPLSPLESRFAHHADSSLDGYGRLIKVSLREIPPPTRAEKSTGIPRYDVDARLILAEVLPGIQNPATGTLPAMRLYGFSEGAGVVISAAANINQLERNNPDQDYRQNLAEKHNLTLFSLTGIGNIVDNPEQARQAIFLFSKEVARITWDQIATKFPVLFQKLREKKDDNAHPSPGKGSQPENPLHYLIYALKDAGVSIKNLGQVVKRFTSAKTPAHSRNQLSKLLRYNPDCNAIGNAFNVAVRAPLGDSIYSHVKLDSFLKEEKQTYTRRARIDTILNETIATLAFPSAHRVTVDLIGTLDHRGRPHISSNHHLPEKKPELVLPDDATVLKNMGEEIQLGRRR